MVDLEGRKRDFLFIYFWSGGGGHQIFMMICG
jgi:hypothetical protein